MDITVTCNNTKDRTLRMKTKGMDDENEIIIIRQSTRIQKKKISFGTGKNKLSTGTIHQD